MLATVKGDVHDIGKNLVEIILANNGYQVINLGIKVPPEDLIQAWQEHQPDAIGLSGLLVKSAQQMVTTASDFKDHGVSVPLLVGGAALSEKFTTHAHRPGLRRADVLRQGRHDRPAHHERADGPGDARSRARARTFSRRGRRAAPEPRRAATHWHRAQPQSAHRYSDSRGAVSRPPRPRRAATWPKSGATSIRSCCTAGTSASRAISKKLLAERDPKALELFHDVEEVKHEAARVHEGARGVAVLRSRARRQLRFTCSRPARRARCTPSTSAASREPTACA